MSEELQKVQSRLAYAESRLVDMQQCEQELKDIQERCKDFLWHRQANSAAQLFMAICLLEREIQQAQRWVEKEKTNLYFAQERAAGRIK